MASKNRPVCLDDYESLAGTCLSEAAFEYVASGAANEETLRANRNAFAEISLLPRVLQNVSDIDTRVEIFGREHTSPVLLAPVGYHRLFHERGELETIAGANRAGCTLIAACFATERFETVQAQAKRPQWFQLYVQKDRGLTRDLVERVLAAGCEAICVTVDLPVNATRDREARIGFELPPGVRRENLAGSGIGLAEAAHSPVGHDIYNAVRASDLTWKDIDWLRSFVTVPLLLKGILRPEDAVTALRCGCDGVVVSNHGGRALDGVPSTICSLPRIADSLGGSMKILIDGGVRRGTDVVKAIAYGAHAVLIGRPYIYGLATGGADGLADVIEMLRMEIRVAMGLLGCSGLAQLDRSLTLSRAELLRS